MQIHDTKFTSFLVNNTPVPFFPIKNDLSTIQNYSFFFKINELSSFQIKSYLCLIFPSESYAILLNEKSAFVD